MSETIWKQQKNEVKNAYIYSTKTQTQCIGVVIDVIAVRADRDYYFITKKNGLALTIKKDYVKITREGEL